MPGKVNPVIPEAINQIAYLVAGADLTVTMAAENGQLQLNAFEPVMAHALLQSLFWLTNGCEVLTDLCVNGIEASDQLLRSGVRASSAQATALVPLLGYKMASDAANRALATGQSAIDIALEEGWLSRDQATAMRTAG